MSVKRLSCVILAAGLGTRMKSSISKVLHRLNGIPMLEYIVRVVDTLGAHRTVVVAGRHNIDALKDSLKDRVVEFAIQPTPLGTAHALLSGTRRLSGVDGDILVLNGDTPLITTKTLKSFVTKHRRARNDLSIISFITEQPYGYGRIVRDSRRRPIRIIEEKNATEQERLIKEVNSGVYLLNTRVLPLLRRIKKDSIKAEYYLTDLLELASQKGYRCGVYPLGDEEEFLGINTKEELMKAQRILRVRMVRYWLARDVSFMDENSVYIHPDVRIGSGCLIYPNVHIEGMTTLGKGCVIYPNVRITDSTIGDNVVIKDNTVIESAAIESNVIIGPFARLRPETLLRSQSRIGNFVEIKASEIGKGTKAQHLSYIGDAVVGENVNIGAGTITCNYDGVKKHKTLIEDNVFIGSDTQLVAPVRVGKGAYVGAGSTITEDVPEDALALTRVRQSNIKGWVKKRKKRK